MTTMTESVVDPEALNLREGRFGTCFNGQTFQVDALTSLGDRQYATYVDHEGRVCVARRRWPDGAWQHIAFDDHVIDHDDVHNVPVIGVCPADGTVHLAFDHHVSPLHYRVSRPGVATSPDGVEWSEALFGAITSELVDGAPLERLTYPNFVTMPDGALQLYYRLGSSGDGDTHVAEYRPGQGGWTMLGAFVSGRGRFAGSDSRNAYHNGFDYDAAGRLHTTWVWRESPDLRTNHDLQYAYSDDRGRTWRNNDGAPIGVTDQDPLWLGSPGVTVRPIAYGWGMMNQLTQTVDTRGRLHVVLWQQPPDASAPSADMSTWRYVHHWRDEHGGWHQRQLPCFGRKPSVVADGDDNLVLVFTKPADPDYHGTESGGPLHVVTASSADHWGSWREVYRSSESYVGEPRIDRHRWQDSAVLSVYAQQAPVSPGTPSPLRVVDLDLGAPT
ncbi:BNR repeat-containing protein [Jiangella endophytica]|uniref:BNR repeat-containing protein n=1 Tax=Jiangella endophytica TaxID=1623398 RepID=UPI0013006E30|nr:BNR repeat-containing protein [Jiangella endophytica]